MVPRDQLNMTKLMSLKKDMLMVKKWEMGGKIVSQYFCVGLQNFYAKNMRWRRKIVL